MFDDPKKELQRLEQQLLQEEEDEWLDRQLEQAHALLGDELEEPEEDMDATRVYRDLSGQLPVRNYANGYGAQPMYDFEEEYADEAEEEEEPPREKGVGGLVMLAILETLGILAVIAYWLIMIL